MNVNVYTCFIDYRKAFDMVKHDKLIEILKSTGIHSKDIQIITELYWNQVAEIRVENVQSEVVEIQRGVRQGCVLSPLLFNLYAEAIFKEALDGSSGGIRSNGVPTNNIRYADDTVIIARSGAELQQMLNSVVQHSEALGLTLNTGKTKCMVFSKHPVNVTIKVKDEVIEQVSTV